MCQDIKLLILSHFIFSEHNQNSDLPKGERHFPKIKYESITGPGGKPAEKHPVEEGGPSREHRVRRLQSAHH